MPEEREPTIGDRLYHPRRPDKERKGYFAANGEIVNLILGEEDTDYEIQEVVVQFSPGDTQNYFTHQMEYIDALGGYWEIV